MAKLVEEKYVIEHRVKNKLGRITVIISADDKVTIDTMDNHRQFAFTNSDPDLVAAIGKCLQEAAELVEQRKVSAV